MQHDTVRAAPGREPCFEPPPRLTGSPERRLSGRAATALAGRSGLHAFRDNALSLVAGDDGDVVVTAVGVAIAAAFGLTVGPLKPDAGTLGECLVAAFERIRTSDAVTGVEGAVATPQAACVLLRGVVLPTATGADAVLSWKQVLDADATARIRAELLREMAVPGDRRPATDAFA
jgi:hypothetical protein